MENKIDLTELRNKKVSIDLDEHYIGGGLKIEDKTDETKFENGYICKNENHLSFSVLKKIGFHQSFVTI